MNATISSERIAAGLRTPENWRQLIRFGMVGLSGFVITFLLFWAFHNQLGLHYLIAHALAFLVAVSNNFVWNRHWTFRTRRDGLDPSAQIRRFFIISGGASAIAAGFLSLFVQLGLTPLPSEVIATGIVTPISFLGNRLWSFAQRSS